MRKAILTLVVCSMLTLGGCRTVSWALWKIPEFIEGKIFNVYTGNGHYDGRMRWDNLTQGWQKITNVLDIYFFNYDVRDPYLGTPFFGDPH